MLVMRDGSLTLSPLQRSWLRSAQREKEEGGGRGEEEAAGGEGSPGEGQGGGHQQTDTGNEAKTQGCKDRAIASVHVCTCCTIISVN